MDTCHDGETAQVIEFPRSAAAEARTERALPVAADAASEGADPGPGRPRKKRKGGKKRDQSADDEIFGSRRGVETLFRTAFDTHLTLHSMADNKARMMIQVNGLILSVLLAAGARVIGAGGGSGPAPAAFVLFAAGAISLLFAVVAARPRGRRHSLATGLSDRSSGGIMLFSEFSGMSAEDYVESMKELMRHPESLYRSMSLNLHTMGQLLERKYARLRVSYGALAVGVVGAAVVWAGVPGRWIL